MQAPVGYIIQNGKAEMVDFWVMISNPTGIIKFFHSIFSGYVVCGFFVMGVSCYHFLKQNEIIFFKKSFTIAAFFSLVNTILVAITGDIHEKDIAYKQPTKFAAMESV